MHIPHVVISGDNREVIISRRRLPFVLAIAGLVIMSVVWPIGFLLVAGGAWSGFGAIVAPFVFIPIIVKLWPLAGRMVIVLNRDQDALIQNGKRYCSLEEIDHARVERTYDPSQLTVVAAMLVISLNNGSEILLDRVLSGQSVNSGCLAPVNSARLAEMDTVADRVNHFLRTS